LRRLAAILLSLLIALEYGVVYADDQALAFKQGEVIVYGERTPAEVIGASQILTEKDIRALGARNVAEVLQAAVGLRIDTAPTSLGGNGKHESLVSLRGFDPRNVIVLIDGVPVYEPFFRVLDLRQIPVADVAKIKIVKGATSVLYGPNALAGIINIITKKGDGPPKARIESGYGDVNRYDAGGTVRGGANGFEYVFTPGFETSDGYRISDDFEKTRNEDGGLRENSDYTDYYLSGKVGWTKAANSIALSANHYGFEGGVPFNMEAIEPSTLWRKDWQKTGAALHGELAPSDFFYARARAFYTRFYNTITTYEDSTMSAVLDDGDAVSTYDNDVAGAILMPQFLLGKAGTITLSGIYKIDLTSTQSELGAQWLDFGAETWSAAAQYEAAVSIVRFTGGVAWHFFRRTETPGDVLGKDNEAIDWQAGAAVVPLPWLEIFAAVAQKSAFPDLRTLYGSNGNPDLKPEYALNIDAGVRANPIPQLGLETGWFYSEVTDLIGKRELGNEFTYENVDNATITGIESAVSLSFFQGAFTTRLSHTYMDTTDDREDRNLKSLDFRPEQMAFTDARVRLPFGTALSAQYAYTGERKYEEPSRDREVKTLPEVGLFNARLSQIVTWDENETSCEFFVEGKNLGDVYYEQAPQKASPGRMIRAGLAFEF
jgi:outer membrane cobalamin receptor